MKLTHPRVLIWLYSLEPPLLALICLLLLIFSGWSLFAWVVPAFIFLVLPILDYRSRDDDNFSHRLAVKHLTKHRSFFQWVARAYALPQFLVLALAILTISVQAISGWALLALALTVGIVNGIAIAPAHELNHTTNRVNRLFASIMVAPTGYGHFLVEHNVGHHVRVATPEDPASARYGENVWAFSIRSLVLGFRSACKFEFQNRSAFSSAMVHSWALTALLFICCTALAGTQGLIFFVAQAAIGAFLLEAVNYIEHYGLLRQKNENGNYEPCTPQHSWNSNKLVSNIGLFNLQRHSDHHAHASRPYELLRHHPDAPLHPTGYAGMLVIAMIPPIWFRLMNPRVLAHYHGDLSKVNRHPRLR